MEVESLYVDDHIIFEKRQQNRELWQQLKQKEMEELALFRQIEESIQNQFSSFNPTLTPSIPSLPNANSIHSISPGALKVTSSSAGLELDLGSPSPQEPRSTSVSNVQSFPTNHFTQRSPEPIYKPYSIPPFHDTNDRTIALPDPRNYNEISKRFNDPNSSNRHSVVEDNRSENGMESFQFDDSHTWGDVTIDEAPSFLVKRAEPVIGKSFLFDETELQDITSSNTTTSASASTPTSADHSSQLSNDSHEASLPSVPQSNLIRSLFPGLQKDKGKEKFDSNKELGVNPNVRNIKVQSKDSTPATSKPSEHLNEELQEKLKDLLLEGVGN
ncbi:hypothetical protein BKA69DRAFT_908114 [Paraphysoderma sedebokerense]|nr:hypothetical protein BKA69DRAFT_908114 [Paraphysoderma sedebokerense]